MADKVYRYEVTLRANTLRELDQQYTALRATFDPEPELETPQAPDQRIYNATFIKYRISPAHDNRYIDIWTVKDWLQTPYTRIPTKSGAIIELLTDSKGALVNDGALIRARYTNPRSNAIINGWVRYSKVNGDQVFKW